MKKRISIKGSSKQIQRCLIQHSTVVHQRSVMVESWLDQFKDKVVVIMKELKSFTDLGLKEAKALVEKTPPILKA
ncbi:unnamed protein product [Arabidopsis lyrata]|nr:unnamed protein product [Arabidopsis lyrata]